MNTAFRISNDIEEEIKTNIPNNKTCDNLASFYSIFCDSTRLKILITLSLSQMCVNDIVRILGINQTTVSHQLKILRTIGAVVSFRSGKWIIYKVTDKFVNNIMLNGVDYILQNK